MCIRDSFLLPINIAYEPVKIDFPFEVEDVKSVEMYHYDGVPASAEKKVVVAENDNAEGFCICIAGISIPWRAEKACLVRRIAGRIRYKSRSSVSLRKY